MYCIIHIPTGISLKEVKTVCIDDKLKLTEDFYSKEDCKKFLRNFLEYDNFQRRFKTSRWLLRNNRFTFTQYTSLFTSLGVVPTAFNPKPARFSKEEFMILKTKRTYRLWHERQ